MQFEFLRAKVPLSGSPCLKPKAPRARSYKSILCQFRHKEALLPHLLTAFILFRQEGILEQKMATEAFDERFFGADVAFLLIWTILPEKRASALYLNLTTLVLPEWSFLM